MTFTSKWDCKSEMWALRNQRVIPATFRDAVEVLLLYLCTTRERDCAKRPVTHVSGSDNPNPSWAR